MYTILEVFGLAPLVVVALARVVDARTGRGYSLGILSLLLLACTSLEATFFTLSVQQFRQNPPAIHELDAAMILGTFLFFAFFIAAYCTLSLLIGAVVVAGVAGQWLWLVGLIVAGLLPGVISDPAAQQQRIMDVLLIPGGTALLAIPQAAVLAYSIARIIHSTRARQPVPLG